jgi:two-component system sensor histidine kinase UhpB
MTASPAPPKAAPAAASRAFPLPEILITLVYMVLGAVWVIGTDTLVGRLLGEPRQSMSLQTLKGLNFVVTTGLLYYFVLRRSFHRRRKAEEVARLEQERFELAARAATDAIWDMDVKAGKLWWSAGIEKLFGYSRAEAGESLEFWTERLHPDEREQVETGFRRAIDGTASFWADEYRFRCRDGHYAFVLDRGFLIRDAEGRAVRMVGGMTDITRRKEAEQRLEGSRRQLRALSARLESLREEERTRIAREIHDQLGQLLTALKMDLRWMEKRLSSGENNPALNPILDKLVEAGELADSTIVAVQKISSELRPGTLDNLGLPAALEYEAGRFQERTGIACVVTVRDPPPVLSPDAATAIFRIFQEALTNVARHAEATEVRCDFLPEDGQLVLRIEDNGKGISPEALANPRSLGLLGMQERAAVLGGEVRIEPGAARGTRMTLRLPHGADLKRFWTRI